MALPAAAAAVAPGIPAALYLLVFVGLALTAVRRRWPVRIADNHRSRLQQAAQPGLFLAAMLAFGAHVVSVWHEGRTAGSSIDGIGRTVAGAIPWLDSGLYVGGALRLLLFSELDDFGARRPLSVMYYAALQGLTGLDVRAGILVQAVLLGIACYLLVRAVAWELGPLAGLAMFAAFFGHAFFPASGTLSEAPGAILGGVAFTVLWQGVAHRVLWRSAAGLFLMAFALEVRAGPSTLLVVLAFWLAWHLRGTGRFNFKALVLLLVLAVSGTLITRLAVAGLDGDPDNLYGSSAYVLYGMAHGQPGWTPAGEPVSWQRVFVDHPELYGMEEADRGAFVRELTGEQLRAEPGKFISAYFGGARNYLILSRDRILAPFPEAARNPIWILSAAAAAILLVRRWRLHGWGPAVADAGLLGGAVISASFLLDYWFYSGRFQPEWFALVVVALGFAAFGVLGSHRLGRPDLSAFSVACLAGLAASIPLLGADGIRVFGAVVPVFSLPFVLSVVVVQAAPSGAGEPVPQERRADPAAERRALTPVLVGAGLALFVLAGAPIAMALVSPGSGRAPRCDDGSEAQALYGGISLGVEGPGGERLDRLSPSRFEGALKYFADFVPEAADPDTRSRLRTIVSGVTSSGSDRIAFVSNDVEAPGHNPLWICGRVVSGPLIDSLRAVYPVPFDFFVGQPAPDGRDQGPGAGRATFPKA